MNINSITSNAYHKTGTETSKKALDKYKEAYQTSSKEMDKIEISSEALERQSDEKLSAASGKDSLPITKGSEDNTYVIHFSDSAMVSRTISRGYIIVNGTRIELSDEEKKQLTQIDEQAQANREEAFNEYIMQHETAVAKQQGEAYQKMAEGVSRAFAIAAKISRGGKASGTEEKELMEFNPELYAMAKNAAMMARRQEKQETEMLYKLEKQSNKAATQEDAAEGVDGSSFSWKTYETQMKVSLADSPTVGEITEGEIELNK